MLIDFSKYNFLFPIETSRGPVLDTLRSLKYILDCHSKIQKITTMNIAIFAI